MLQSKHQNEYCTQTVAMQNSKQINRVITTIEPIPHVPKDYKEKRVQEGIEFEYWKENSHCPGIHRLTTWAKIISEWHKSY